MFIKEIQKMIWAPATTEYHNTQKKLLQKSDTEIRQSIINDLEQSHIERENSRYFQSINFMTSGCPHCKNSGKFAGCTFCDFISPQVVLLAKCSLLRQRNIEMYNETVLHSISLYRKKLTHDPLVLFFTGFDTLSNDEIPDSLIQQFNEYNMFDNSFTQIIGFDARAESVNEKSLKQWRSLTNKAIGINIGVEISDEWLRNHWANKNTTNDQLYQAIKLLREQQFQISLSALVGIPGLTQKQSIEIFIQTFSWIWTQFHPETIMCGPLIFKEYTMQNVLRKLGETGLINSGIVGATDSCSISTFVFYEALSLAVEIHPDARHNIKVNPVLFHEYKNKLMHISEENMDIQKVMDLFEQCIQKNDFIILIESRKNILQLESYKRFRENIDKQDPLFLIRKTMLNTVKHLVDFLIQKERQSDLILDFSKELDAYPFR